MKATLAAPHPLRSWPAFTARSGHVRVPCGAPATSTRVRGSLDLGPHAPAVAAAVACASHMARTTTTTKTCNGSDRSGRSATATLRQRLTHRMEPTGRPSATSNSSDRHHDARWKRYVRLLASTIHRLRRPDRPSQRSCLPRRSSQTAYPTRWTSRHSGVLPGRRSHHCAKHDRPTSQVAGRRQRFRSGYATS